MTKAQFAMFTAPQSTERRHSGSRIVLGRAALACFCSGSCTRQRRRLSPHLLWSMAITALRLRISIGQTSRPRRLTDASPGTSAADSRQQLNTHLTWKRAPRATKSAQTRTAHVPRLGVDDQTSAPGQAAQARAAGSPLGTVLEGPLTGEEVRPALPVVSPDPHRRGRRTGWPSGRCRG